MGSISVWDRSPVRSLSSRIGVVNFMASHFLGLAWLRIAVAPVSMALPLVALLGGLALGQNMERYADIPADSIVVASVDFRELKDSAQFRMWPW
ncbi:MAG: hypothetical protein ACK5PZ_12370, partial [Pirellula sp.]